MATNASPFTSFMGFQIPPVTIASGPKNNYTAITNPNEDNDETEGYSIGSEWLNTLSEEAWVCIRATAGDARWSLTTNIDGFEPNLGLPNTDGDVLSSDRNGTRAWVTRMLTTGSTIGATMQAQAFTNGVITGHIRPNADSTTAFGIFKANGTTKVLNIDTTNGRMGIGTIAPGYKLHTVSGTGGGQAAFIGPQYSDVELYIGTEVGGNRALRLGFTDYADGNPTYGYLNVYGYAKLMTWTDTSKVGISTTVPLRKLDINSATGDCLRLIYNDSNGSAVNYSDFLLSSIGDLSIMPTNYMGLGTLTPIAKLHVAGSTHIDGTFTNYDSTLMSMGVSQTSDLRGYGNDYVAEKTLAYCRVGGAAYSTEGSIRNNAGTFQIYLNGVWNDVVTGFRFREDPNEGYELEHKPTGFTWWYSVATGNSDMRGLNGLPLAQRYVVSMGCYPVPVQLSGGTF